MTSSTQGLLMTNLTFGYEGQALFSSFSAQVPPGLSWLLGDEGSGKSSLLKLMSGTLKGQAGDLELNGQRLSGNPEAYKALVFWTDARTEIFDQISAREYFASLHPKFPSFNQTLLENLQAEFDLTPHLDKKLFMLSNGSKRKVWLAAAFASGAALTLIDDPFAALDRPSIKVVRELLEDAAEQATRTFVVADYAVPEGLAVTKVIELSPPLASR
jgi:ABC-type multidrug transport system ATPase subunit